MTKTVSVTLYSFDELDSKAQAKALNDHSANSYFHSADDFFKEMHNFADAFDFKITYMSYEYPVNVKSTLTDESVEHITLDTISEDFIQKQINTSCECYYTETLWDTFKNAMKDNAHPAVAIRAAMTKALKDISKEYDYFYSKEGFKENCEANEYLFFENGELIPNCVSNVVINSLAA